MCLLALRAELRTRSAYAHQPEPKLAELLDLVALGTIADVVKLDHTIASWCSRVLQRIRAGHASLVSGRYFKLHEKNPARASRSGIWALPSPCASMLPGGLKI